MFESSHDMAAPTARLAEALSIQFFAIELSPTADGRYFVGVGATICEREGELAQMDLGNHRVATLHDAIEVIRQAVSNVH
jgi:hypothetical protein